MEQSSSILASVVQLGHLDFKMVTDCLTKMTFSKSGQFFEIDFSGKLVCRYSSDDSFFINNRYSFDEISSDQFLIFHKSIIIAIICFENVDKMELISPKEKQHIHDSICIGLVLGNLKNSNYSFTMTICSKLSKIVQQALSTIVTFSQSSQNAETIRLINSLNSILDDAMSIIYDAIEFVEIDAEKSTLHKDLVKVSDVIDESISVAEVSTLKKEIEDSVPEFLVFDNLRITQIMSSILKRIKDIPDLTLNVKLENFSTRSSLNYFFTCLISSNTTKNNQEIMNKFQMAELSVDNLPIFILKRLCEIMNGTFKVSLSGVFFTIKVDIPGKTDIFKDKYILVGVQNSQISRQLAEMFDKLKSIVNFVVSYENIDFKKYSLIILDSSKLSFANYMKSQQNIPVLGILENYEKNLVSNFTQVKFVPFNIQQIQSVCEKLLLGQLL